MKERSLEIENLKKICDLKNAQIVELEKRVSLSESQDKQECLAVLALTSKIDSILEQNKKETEKFSEKLSTMKATTFKRRSLRSNKS